MLPLRGCDFGVLSACAAHPIAGARLQPRGAARAGRSSTCSPRRQPRQWQGLPKRLPRQPNPGPGPAPSTGDPVGQGWPVLPMSHPCHTRVHQPLPTGAAWWWHVAARVTLPAADGVPALSPAGVARGIRRDGWESWSLPVPWAWEKPSTGLALVLRGVVASGRCSWLSPAGMGLSGGRGSREGCGCPWGWQGSGGPEEPNLRGGDRGKMPWF